MLRETLESDVSVFFEQQLSAAANRMAASTRENPADREAFDAQWKKTRGNAAITVRTILRDGQVAGYIASFSRSDKPEVSYWLGSEYWGRGIATNALSEFLKIIPARPLYARAAKDNVASLQVLKKCGFEICGEDKVFANARGEEVEEFVLALRG